MKKFCLGKYETNGINKFFDLKKLLKNKEICNVLLGSNPVCNMMIADDVNIAVKLVNNLSALTGISGVDIITATKEKKYEDLLTPIIIEKDKLKSESMEKDDGWMDILISWANENNLSDFKTDGRISSGFPRDKKVLINLDILNLIKTGIKYLPPELGRMKNLSVLWLNDNNIDEYPKEMCYLPYLIELDMDNNNITNLPKEISELKSLRKLLLRNNKIVDLPIEMIKLKNLTKLDLRDQPIPLNSAKSPLSANGLSVMRHFYSRDIGRF